MRRLLALARHPLAGAGVGWLFAHASFLLPVRRLHETSTLLAFWHPAPSYPIHILLVPKRAIPGVEMLGDADAALLAEIIRTAHTLAAQVGLDQTGYRLITNGGAYQDVKQLHFHLIPAQDDVPIPQI